MKTVRLSQQLMWDISAAADKKFDNANPTKVYPDAGYNLLVEEGIIDKIESTKKMWQSIWGDTLPTTTVEEVRIMSTWTEQDEDGDEKEINSSFSFPIPEMEAPDAITTFDRIRITVAPDNPVLAECISVQAFNDALAKTKREQRWKLEAVMDRFTTLNQLLKAAPYLKDIVPQEKITKMHEKDDRSGRQKELAEVADSELQAMRETLLESSLLGDE